MSHDVAVPEYSADHQFSIGENDRRKPLVALELRHRALSGGAERHRHSTRATPQISNVSCSLTAGRDFVRSCTPAATAGVLS